MNLPKRRFQQAIKDLFTKDELRDLSLGLGINYEELDEKNISTLTESLLLYTEKQGLIVELLQLFTEERPHVNWSELAFEDVDCPYRGLLPFREEDAHLFFGRDVYIDLLLEAVNKQPLVAVIGPSGSGKSSVVFAGLLSRLRQTDIWKTITFRPGKDPFNAISSAIVPLLEPDLTKIRQLEEANALTQSLKKKKTSLSQLFDVITNSMKEGQHLLLIIDQFEELYTQTNEIVEQEQFLEALLSLQTSKSVTVLLTMRADFLGRALLYRPFADELQNASQMIGPMDRNELIEVIERPLSGTFVSFEPGLTTQILDDVGQEPGNLPLLEFALTSLWDEQVDGKLTFAAYEKIGKVEGALTEHANDAYDTFKSEEEAKRVRRLFMQLVQPVTGTVNTKRKARRSELGDELWQLTTQLADERLVVTGQDETGEQTVELAHEALISNWQRFEGWIQEDWEFRAWQERLRAGMRQWQSHENNEGFLLLGAPLTLAEDWLQQRRLDLSQLEISYIEASIEARALRQAEEEARQQHELETAQALAETEKKRAEEQVQAATSLRKRLIYVVGLLAVAAILGIMAVFFGVRSSQSAETATNKEATAVSAQATAEIDRNNAVRSEVEAADAAATAVSANATAVVDRNNAVMNEVEAANAAATAVSANATAVVDRNNAEMNEVEANRQLRISRAQAAAVYGSQVLVDQNDKELATLLALEADYLNNGEDSNVPSLVDEVLRQTLSQPFFNRTLHGFKGDVQSISYDSEGTLAIATGFQGSLYGSVYLWDEKTNLEPQLFKTVGLGVFSVAYSPEGYALLAFGGQRKYLNEWIMDDPPYKYRELSIGEAYVNAIAYSPNGYYLATAASDNTIHLFYWLENKAQHILNGGDGSSVVFSPDNRFLAAAGTDNTVLVWDLDNLLNGTISEDEPIILEGHKGRVRSVAFSPNGTLASASEDGTIRLWNVVNPEEDQFILDKHQDSVNAVDFSSDGQTLASASSDKTIRLWNMNNLDAEPQIIPHTSGVRFVAFSPDSRSLASSTGEETVIIWDLQQPIAEPLTTTGIGTIFVPPDGQLLASEPTYDSVQIQFWNSEDLVEDPGRTIIHEAGISSMVFSNDGQMLFIADDVGGVYQRDLERNSTFEEIIPRDGSFTFDLAISPDEQFLAAARRDYQVISQTIYLQDLTQLNLTPITFNLPSSAYEVEFSPDGKYLISVGEEDPNSPASFLVVDISTVYLWDVGNIEDGPTVLEGHEDSINAIAFSPDGSILAGASSDGTIRLWNMRYPNITPQILRLHTEIVSDVSFSPDGQTLASASYDGNVFLWNVGDFSNTPISLQHESRVRSVAFSLDGQTLATGTTEGTIHLWPLLDEIVELGCQKVRRNLSWEEWQLYLPNQPYRKTCPDLSVHPSVPEDKRP